MSPIPLMFVILAATLIPGPSQARAAQPPSATVLLRNARQLHVIVDRDFRASPLYPQLCQTAERIEHCAEAIHDHFDHPAALPQVRQNLVELNAATARLDQLVTQLPSRTILQAHQAGYQKSAAVHVTIGNGYVHQATTTYRPQATPNPRDVARLQNALADVDASAADFACVLAAWEQTVLWDFGGWDRTSRPGPRPAPILPQSHLGLSDLPHAQWR